MEELEKENKFLRGLLISKNSQNSSIPPSSEIVKPKRTKSLRGSTGRKPGGQTGHKGHNLKMVVEPDVIEKHVPGYCNSCGLDISSVSSHLVGKRQLIDIPAIRLVTTEHQVFERVCNCGKINRGCFPANANAPVGYGENLEALTAYFHARQYLPIDRMKELIRDVFGVSISTGGICHLLNRFASKSTPVYQHIKEKLCGELGQEILRIAGAIHQVEVQNGR